MVAVRNLVSIDIPGDELAEVDSPINHVVNAISTAIATAAATTYTGNIMKVQTWIDWNGGWHASGTTTNVISSETVGSWAVWNDKMRRVTEQAIYRAVTATTTNSWIQWNTNWRLVNETSNGIVSARAMPETPEQTLRRQRERDDIRAANERQIQAYTVADRERIAAKEKAEKLLQSALDAEQREELRSKGFFHCKSGVGNRYRIYRGSHGNVKLLNQSGKEVEKLCVQPHYVPEGDCMLAQKLHIEHNEEDFRRTANITLLH